MKKFKMQDSKMKGYKTPLPTNGKLDADVYGKDYDQKADRSMIGSLLYLCASRPDTMLSVCMCVCYQVASKESHHQAVKHILGYLAHTPTLGLWYPKGAQFDLVGYSDSDWAGDLVDRKSTSGHVIFSIDHWSIGHQGSRIVYLFLRLRPNILLLALVALSYCG